MLQRKKGTIDDVSLCEIVSVVVVVNNRYNVFVLLFKVDTTPNLLLRDKPLIFENLGTCYCRDITEVLGITLHLLLR